TGPGAECGPATRSRSAVWWHSSWLHSCREPGPGGDLGAAHRMCRVTHYERYTPPNVHRAVGDRSAVWDFSEGVEGLRIRVDSAPIADRRQHDIPAAEPASVGSGSTAGRGSPG